MAAKSGWWVAKAGGEERGQQQAAGSEERKPRQAMGGKEPAAESRQRKAGSEKWVAKAGTSSRAGSGQQHSGWCVVGSKQQVENEPSNFRNHMHTWAWYSPCQPPIAPQEDFLNPWYCTAKYTPAI
ncbi:hypothetical protein FIBSPDRAFT_982288 [Athelia psychrophila]|uniref:Uncharacterized protein n=1 Tax=Athelia psychrophila TaxID=1759441 RepID=A0A166T8J0_9AGAM|nr:hypothetical protein FIBSPDRAFT_982288 [Fibularhizoctonia sp. CBS 109695]